MDLDRGTLARVDRKLLAGLGQDETFQMVRIPVTAAKWATWKRYCGVAGISMGRAISALVDRELVRVFGVSSDDDVPVFAREVEEKLAVREERVTARERDLEFAEDRLRGLTERLRLWEDELRKREQHVEFATKLDTRPRVASPKIGRNERCPCGSRLKYKHCHGLADG